MTDVLVDSNVILDIVTEDADWFEWSSHKLSNYADQGKLLINPIVYAEVSMGFERAGELDALPPPAFFQRSAR